MGVAEFRQALVSYDRVAVDTMIFIYLLDDNPQYAALASALFELIEASELEGITSTLTMAEVLTFPARQGNTAAMQGYELYLTNFPNLRLISLDTNVARTAATVRARTRVKMPDAVQIATALALSADAIVSNDKQWRNKFADPTLILLDDYL